MNEKQITKNGRNVKEMGRKANKQKTKTRAIQN